MPCGTSSKVTSPFRISSSAGDEPPALAVNETIRCRTRPASTRVWAPGGIVLPTKQRSLVPRSSSAASRLKGAPALGPKPETAIDAPSGKSLIASAGEVRSLSMCLACVRRIAVTRSVRAKNDRAAAVSWLRRTPVMSVRGRYQGTLQMFSLLKSPVLALSPVVERSSVAPGPRSMTFWLEEYGYRQRDDVGARLYVPDVDRLRGGGGRRLAVLAVIAEADPVARRGPV